MSSKNIVIVDMIWYDMRHDSMMIHLGYELF
jgi:hypothetical protein